MDSNIMDKNSGDKPVSGDRRPDDSAHPQTGHEGLPRQQIERCIQWCGERTLEYIAETFPRFWDEWLESIEKREAHARSNKEQVMLNETLRQLRSIRAACQQQFVERVQKVLLAFAQQRLHTPSGQERFSNTERLSLVDNSELEETIAITSICHRADNQQSDRLWSLHQRLAILNGGKKIDERSNPVSPIQFCEALRAELSDLSLDTRCKVVGYKQFETQLIKPLGQLYQAINEYLAEQGILPNLRYTAKVQQEAATPAAKAEPAPVEQPPADPAPQRRATEQAQGSAELPKRRATDKLFESGNPGDAEQYQKGLVSAIRLLQTHIAEAGVASGGGGSGGASAAGNGAGSGASVGLQAFSGAGGAAVQSERLVGVVQALQSEAATRTRELADAQATDIQAVPVAAVSESLAEQLRQQGEERVQADDMHTIELVGLLFEYILSDDQLPDSVKALLSYLHTPVLKLAFIDPEFFDDVDHPARVLLNQMADAGARWVSNDGTSQYNIYGKIKSTVFEVLENFGNDVKVFAEALIEFRGYTRNVARRQELMEKRALEKARGEEKLREAKIQVNTDISGRIDGLDLPSPILLLLLLPWSDYLSFVILRYGAESDSYKKALGCVDELLWSIEPKTLEADKIRQVELQDRLLNRLQNGFDTIGYEQNKSRKLLDAVISLQQMARKSRKAEPAPDDMRTKLENMAAEKAGKAPEEKREISDEEAELVEKLKLIEFGTWLENKAGQRLKVAWYNHKTLHYMLVDQQGRKVSMSSALEMARQMIDGQLRIIAGSAKPFFERALENIYHSLNAKASGELLKHE